MFFMSDEMNPVNDLVKEHIAKQSNQGDVNNQQQETKKEGGEEKAGAAPEEKKEPAPDPVKSLLESLGVQSVDQLKEKLTPKKEEPKKELTPEEKEKEENVYKSNVLNYAVENGLMKPDDFVKLESLKSKADLDLVYEKFVSEQKEDDPDLTDDEIKENFEKQYPLNSENAKAKARAEAKIKKEAAEFRTPLESSFNKAKSRFDEQRDLGNNFPEFSKTIENFVNGAIPEKFEAFKTKIGEKEVTIDVEITKEEREAIAKSVREVVQSPDNYDVYKKKDLVTLKEMTEKATMAFVRDRKMNEAFSRISEQFFKEGKEAKAVGAENPFPLVDESAGKAVSGTVAERILADMKNKK